MLPENAPHRIPTAFRTAPGRPKLLITTQAGLRDQMGLTNQEIEELDAFLLSDDGRENAMDVSGVDGFLCAVLSGPNVIMRQSGCGGFGILRKASSLRSLR